MKNNIEILTNILIDIFGKEPQLLIPSITLTMNSNIQRSIFFIDGHIVEGLLYDDDVDGNDLIIIEQIDKWWHVHFGVYRVCNTCRNLFITDFNSKKEFDELINEEYPICEKC